MSENLSIVAEEWGNRILSSWQRSAEAIIVTGKLLIEAQDHLEHGEWLPMLKNIGFDETKAQRLMGIARDERLLNPAILPLLPDRWTKIHALHKLPDDKLEQAIRDPTFGKQEARAERERDLGEKQTALPTKKYGVIVADPEWRFEPWSRTTGMDRAADNHYPTSCTEVIAARDVLSIAADDCVLFLWATAPMLPHALVVMAAWGFDYRSNYVWVKPQQGTGYWNRNMHEHLLIGVKGKIPAPSPGTQWPSALHSPNEGHSAKPDQFLEMIEQYFPTLPKIELNRRGPARLNWDAWGNEVITETAAEPHAVEAPASVPHPPQPADAGAPIENAAPSANADAASEPAPDAAVSGAGSPLYWPIDLPPFLRRSVEAARKQARKVELP